MEQSHRPILGTITAVVLAVFGSWDALEQALRMGAYATASIVSIATLVGMIRNKRKNRRNRHY